MVGRKLDSQRAEVVLELGQVAGPDDRRGDALAVEDPVERDLRGRLVPVRRTDLAALWLGAQRARIAAQMRPIYERLGFAADGRARAWRGMPTYREQPPGLRPLRPEDRAALAAVDGRLLQAARTLGAGPIDAFGSIIPEIRADGSLLLDGQGRALALQGWTQSVRVEKLERGAGAVGVEFRRDIAQGDTDELSLPAANAFIPASSMM